MRRHPELPPALVRIERDEAYIAMLEAAVSAFSRTLEEQTAVCQERGWIKPNWRATAESTPRPMSATDAMREALLESQRAGL